MNKAVIFDLDGTLIDSVHDIKDSLNFTLKKFGYEELPLSEVMQYIGNGARNLIMRSVGAAIWDDELTEILDCYNRVYTDSGSPKTRLFDGVDEMLISLKAMGYKLAILTNKPQMTVYGLYQKHLAKFGFDKVMGQSGTSKCKPDKEAPLAILRQLGAEPKNSYMIGDGEPDVQTGINAGMNKISALWGYRTREQLEAVGATVFALGPSDVKNLGAL